MRISPQAEGDRRLAVWAEALFLLNLMVAPVLAFLVLAWLYLRHRRRAGPLARNHLSQAFGVSLAGGALLAAGLALLLAYGEISPGMLWMWAVLYFTFVHSALILMGALALAKAMNGEPYRYPLLGRLFAP